MGKQYTALNDDQRAFINQQKIFFVGTAAAEGKVNISPKGMDSFRVLSATQVAWLNVTGSGNETATHVQELPRMTIMFCAFDGKPEILRLYGLARVLHRGDDEWQTYSELFPSLPGARQIFIQDIALVQSSCGFSVPLFSYEGERGTLTNWAEQKGQKGVEEYWLKKNQVSLDGKETHIKALSKL